MSLLDNIEQRLKWFGNNCDSCELAVLMEKRDKLSVESFALAKIVAEAQTGYNSAYFIRRISINRTANKMIQNGLAVNKANIEALDDPENIKIFEQEKDKESEAFKNNLLLKQINQVLEAMKQRIAIQRKELES